jgi:hypothetical protein
MGKMGDVMKNRNVVLLVAFLLLVLQPIIALGEDVAEEPYSILPPTVYQTNPFEQTGSLPNLGDVVGGKSGYIHPYLSIGEYFTDNLFSREYKRQSDFITRVIPGVWAVYPASREQLLRVNTLNTTPGGLELSRFRTASTGRLQAYGLYQLDSNFHDRFSSEDRTNQRGEGMLRYNLRGGLSFEVFDVYELDHDGYGTGASRSLDKFKSNLASGRITYDYSPKLSFEAEYGYYFLEYGADENTYRDRNDNSVAARVFYRILPRTSVFVEYGFIDISYDEDILTDSTQNQAHVGVQWEVTTKSRARFKLGYQNKDFDDPVDESHNDIIGEFQFDHRFTPKTSVRLRATRKTSETDIIGGNYILAHKVQLRYIQRLTAKLTGSINFYYQNDSYRSDVTVGGETAKRDDDYFSAGLGLRYALQSWLTLTGGYEFLKRDSNFDTNDYDKNTVYLNVIFTL